MSYLCILVSDPASATQIFDLKGSTRNRHVQSTGRENEVLLDENLVQSKHWRSAWPQDLTLFTSAAHTSPFYVREHNKRILRGALFNDTRFLAEINVMDYSLVVGVDSQKNELVVGIVGKPPVDISGLECLLT